MQTTFTIVIVYRGDWGTRKSFANIAQADLPDRFANHMAQRPRTAELHVPGRNFNYTIKREH